MLCRLAICFLLLITSFATLNSCTSKDVSSPKVNSSRLSGVWELRFRIGGMIANDPGTFVTGNGDIWRFTDNRYEKINHDTLYESGTYKVSGEGINPNTGEQINQFIMNGSTFGLPFTLQDGKLSIYYGPIAADGVVMVYEKISDDTSAVSH